MSRNRNKTRKRRTEGEIHPVRTIFTVLGILTAAFAGLAQFATPAPDENTAYAPGHVAHTFPEMDKKHGGGGLFGGSSIRKYAERMRQTAVDPNFQLGPLRIGMTYNQFLHMAEGGENVRAMKDGILGILNTGNHRFNAYFKGRSGKAEAYRLTYHRAFTNRSEREVTEYLGDLWGKPTSASCRRLVLERGEDCNYVWWPVNGVRLTARLKVVQPTTQHEPSVILRIDAIDDQNKQRQLRPYRLAANVSG